MAQQATKQPVAMQLVASNTNPRPRLASYLEAMIRRNIIIEENAKATIYGDFSAADLERLRRWRNKQ
ncbi:hypothetical protein [Oceanobacter kriegii]|uniref:hypothetical protein n=1 Tax=Oceanobacter kriegii TaxID=64972 RepID=UPI0004128EF3|nr:hypothetical protein [Oceanobacter kriegii]